MDVRRVTVDFGGARGRVAVVDAAGARTLELEGAAFARVAEVARAVGLGATGVLDVDAEARAATLTLPDGDVEALPLDVVVPVVRAAASETRARPPQLEVGPSDVRFWETLYRQGCDGWELTRPAPPLLRWFAEHPPAGKRALVVGCGRGHEARLLARAGADVVALDFAADAIAAARALAAAEGLAIDFRQRDLFTLAGERFELVVEHCCFCAIDPARRGEYVDVVARALPSGGELVGLFYAHARAGGPPFSVDRGELERLFTPAFVVTEITVPTDSIATRHGHELLASLRRR